MASFVVASCRRAPAGVDHRDGLCVSGDLCQVACGQKLLAVRLDPHDLGAEVMRVVLGVVPALYVGLDQRAVVAGGQVGSAGPGVLDLDAGYLSASTYGSGASCAGILEKRSARFYAL